MIIIEPYQPKWASEFQQLGRDVRKAIGDLALRIDHIGSTSVPGLAAKDVIDIQVTVAELVAPLEEELNHVGYQRLSYIDRDHVPPGAMQSAEQWQKWFFKAGAPSRPVNLHVRIAGRANQRYPLLFRDYLRAHPAVALAYAETKMALARRHPNDMDAYYDIKDPVCDVIMGAAEEWADRVRWHMRESDC